MFSILYVDDDYDIFLEKLLARRGYTIIGYRSGGKALEDIESGLRYDLALIDLSLDDHAIDGNDVIHASSEHVPEAPIVSFSGYNNKPVGSNRHFVKTEPIEDLFRIIEYYAAMRPSS
jgi:CheY-like chemotaxis protein